MCSFFSTQTQHAFQLLRRSLLCCYNVWHECILRFIHILCIIPKKSNNLTEVSRKHRIQSTSLLFASVFTHILFLFYCILILGLENKAETYLKSPPTPPQKKDNIKLKIHSWDRSSITKCHFRTCDYCTWLCWFSSAVSMVVELGTLPTELLWTLKTPSPLNVCKIALYSLEFSSVSTGERKV